MAQPKRIEKLAEESRQARFRLYRLVNEEDVPLDQALKTVLPDDSHRKRRLKTWHKHDLWPVPSYELKAYSEGESSKTEPAPIKTPQESDDRPESSMTQKPPLTDVVTVSGASPSATLTLTDRVSLALKQTLEHPSDDFKAFLQALISEQLDAFKQEYERASESSRITLARSLRDDLHSVLKADVQRLTLTEEFASTVDSAVEDTLFPPTEDPLDYAPEDLPRSVSPQFEDLIKRVVREEVTEMKGEQTESERSMTTIEKAVEALQSQLTAIQSEITGLKDKPDRLSESGHTMGEEAVQGIFQDQLRNIFKGIEPERVQKSGRGGETQTTKKTFSIPTDVWERCEAHIGKGIASNFVTAALKAYLRLLESGQIMDDECSHTT